ncbi:MAG: hypothetical protein A2471_02305 [Omnitrophica WOR_2 bacterium RIFOXYC2_FULL_45_15]|nr:MAG: hypothetical protein A2471_02305 [Omnitrophica WOR_2 bacterium RIFOXYC2_FULL_45_15]
MKSGKVIILSAAIALWLCVAVSYAEVYSPAIEAARKIFPSQEEYKTERRVLNAQPVEIFTFLKGGEVIGWAVALNEMGKIKPITFLVGIDAQGRVVDVYVLEYRDLFGSEIRRKSFLKQFRNKSSRDTLSVGRDIDAVTQATISSKAAAGAVKKALRIIDELRKDSPHA